MLTEERRKQLDGIVQQMIQNKESDSNIRFVVDDFKQKYIVETIAQPKKEGIGQKILNAGSAVTNFLGGKAVADTFGSEIAKIGATPQEKAIISAEQPGVKQTAGSALQLGSTFVPGAGVGAGVVRKIATGAAIGALSDIGGKLQAGQAPTLGAGTALGATLPILGKLTGLANTSGATGKIAKKLEDINLRLTPVERQNLAKQGKDVADYLVNKKIVGSPEQRFVKVDALYDEAENKVSSVIDNAGLKVNKQQAIDEISKIPEKYTENLSEFDSVVSKVDRIIKTLKTNFGDEIEGKVLNRIKRNEWKNAYSKNNSEVVNEVSHEVGQVFKDILDKNIPGLDSLNDEYGKIITARRVLFKASTRNQVGLLGKAAGLLAGGSIGGAIGGPGGAAVGGFIGPQAVNAVATPVRSAIGAGSQKLSEIINKIPVDQRGKLLIGRKALLDLIQGTRD